VQYILFLLDTSTVTKWFSDESGQAVTAKG